MLAIQRAVLASDLDAAEWRELEKRCQGQLSKDHAACKLSLTPFFGDAQGGGVDLPGAARGCEREAADAEHGHRRGPL